MGILVLRLSLLLLNLFGLCEGDMASLYEINLTNYSKVAIPYLEDTSKTVDVNVSMYILNIGNLDTAQMTFEVEMYFGMKWKDPRLAFREYNNATYALVKGTLPFPKNTKRLTIQFSNIRKQSVTNEFLQKISSNNPCLSLSIKSQSNFLC